MTKREKKITELRETWQNVQDEIAELVRDKQEQAGTIDAKLKKLEFAPIVARIMKGERVGHKVHWCGPYNEFNYKEWKELGWSSAYAYITEYKSPNSYTFNPKLIISKEKDE